MLERYLASGGTADVYVALDLERGQRVALKVLRDDAAHGDELRDFFLAGARAAMRVTHPNVVRVFDVDELPSGRPYAAMELLEGKPLSSILAGERGLPPSLAVDLVQQAADGLAAAHAAGVVHCDVKLDNLFVSGGPRGAIELRILDFDLASVAGAPDPGQGHVLRGTPKYMAPEQIVGDPVDGRSDVYALGVVLFRLLTGQLPFDLPLGTALLSHQLYSPAPPISWLCEAAPPSLEAAVARALCKHPVNRQQTMRQFRSELCAARADARLAVVPDRYAMQSARARKSAGVLSPG